MVCLVVDHARSQHFNHSSHELQQFWILFPTRGCVWAKFGPVIRCTPNTFLAYTVYNLVDPPCTKQVISRNCKSVEIGSFDYLLHATFSRVSFPYQKSHPKAQNQRSHESFRSYQRFSGCAVCSCQCQPCLSHSHFSRPFFIELPQSRAKSAFFCKNGVHLVTQCSKVLRIRLYFNSQFGTWISLLNRATLKWAFSLISMKLVRAVLKNQAYSKYNVSSERARSHENPLEDSRANA